MNKKPLIYVLLGIVVLGLIILTIFPQATYAVKNLFIQNNPEDKCFPPAGYTEQEWREHMSHHPDLYKECLE